MDPYIYRITRFISLSICSSTSFICFLIIFYFLLKSGEISGQQLHNHFIVALLVCNFLLISIDVPITLSYTHRGYLELSSERFCSFWVIENYGLYASGLYLMAFGSIERYFLIFHHGQIQSRSWIFHYVPIIFCFACPLMFYTFAVSVYPCDSTYDFEWYVCGGACYQFQPIIGTLDYMFNIFVPVILIVLGNIVLMVRITCQKRAMQVAQTWKKYRLMYVQLLSISILYLIVWLPFVAISLIRLLYDPSFLQDVILLIINYCLYICPLASPLIALVGLPSVRRLLIANNRIVNWITTHTQMRVRPTELMLSNQTNNIHQ